MKTKITLSIVFCTFFSLLLSSYYDGPAYHAGIVATGAVRAYNGCGDNGSCHGTTTSNNVVLELDSAGIAVQHYYPGQSYTVKISGTNGTGVAGLTHFGFQLTAVLISGSGSASPVSAGTWDSSALPASVHYIVTGGVGVVEHSTQLTANSGTGGAGTYYADSVNWTAPDSGTGTVILAGALNAVNFNGHKTGDYSQVATPDTITEVGFQATTGITPISGPLSGLMVYPTVMNDQITLSFDLKETATISARLISMQGQEVKELVSGESIGTGAFKRTFDVTGLATGVYLVRLEAGSVSVATKVVKE